MISDSETNTIYFSEILQSTFPDTCKQAIDIIQNRQQMEKIIVITEQDFDKFKEELLNEVKGSYLIM